MNGPGHTPALITVVFLALILWRMYVRLRRAVGRQHLTGRRPWITVIVYPLIGVLMASAVSRQPDHELGFLALLGGTAVGIALALYGLRLTRFDVTPEGLYYTPNAHIGIALSLLFLGRLLYRVVMVGPALAAGGGVPVLPPLTLLALGPLIGYYTTYSIGLLRWRGSVAVQTAQPPA